MPPTPTSLSVTRSRVGALALALSLAGALGCGGRSGVGARPDGGSAGSGGGLVGPGIPGVAGAGIPGLAGAGAVFRAWPALTPRRRAVCRPPHRSPA